MVAFSAPSRPRRPALALSAFPDSLSRLYRVPRACWAGSRRATSHAGSSRAASSKTRAERRRAWRARPHARGRRQGRRACWRLCQAPACQKTPRSARDVTEAARLGAARAAGRRRHQARGRRAPPNRQGRRDSREHSTCHTVDEPHTTGLLPLDHSGFWSQFSHHRRDATRSKSSRNGLEGSKRGSQPLNLSARPMQMSFWVSVH